MAILYGVRYNSLMADETNPESTRSVKGFLISVKEELGRVNWPDRKTVVQLTGVVLIFVIIAGAYLGTLDVLWSAIIEWFIEL
jgi:preprotein translocase subunit SecE